MSEEILGTSGVITVCSTTQNVKSEPIYNNSADYLVTNNNDSQCAKVSKKIINVVKKSSVRDKKITQKLSQLLKKFSITEKELCRKLRRIRCNLKQKKNISLVHKKFGHYVGTKTLPRGKRIRKNKVLSFKEEDLVTSTTQNGETSTKVDCNDVINDSLTSTNEAQISTNMFQVNKVKEESDTNIIVGSSEVNIENNLSVSVNNTAEMFSEVSLAQLEAKDVFMEGKHLELNIETTISNIGALEADLTGDEVCDASEACVAQSLENGQENTEEITAKLPQVNVESPTTLEPFFPSLKNDDDIRNKIKLQLELLRNNKKVSYKEESQPSTSNEVLNESVIQKEVLEQSVKVEPDLSEVLLSNEGEHLIVSVVGGYVSDEGNEDSDNVQCSESETKIKLNNSSISITDFLLQKNLLNVSDEQVLEVIKTHKNNAITPTKTKDITKIKGWRTKLFSLSESEVTEQSKDNHLEEPTIEEHPQDESVPTSDPTQNYVDLTQPSTSKGLPLTKIVPEKKCDSSDSILKQGEKSSVNSKAAFVSDALDSFLNNDSELKISYEVPKLVAEEAISKPGDIPLVSFADSELAETKPVKVKKTESTGFKPKTLAEKRKLLEMERKNKIFLTMETNELLLKKLENDDGTENIREYFIKEDIPLSKNCWSLASKRISNQYVICNGEKIKILGSYGEGDIYVKSIKSSSSEIKKEADSKKVTSAVKSGYKPGPLSKKCKYFQALNKNCEYEVLKMPKIKLVLYPELGKELPLIAEQYLSLCKSEKGFISAEFAKYAATAIKTDNPSAEKVEFEIPYSHNQNKILLRKITKKAPDEKIKLDKYPNIIVETEIKNMMSDMLDAIENQSLDKIIIKDDPDLKELTQGMKLPSKKKEVPQSEENPLLQTVIKQRNHKKSKTTLELRRLNVQVIEVDVEESPKSQNAKCEEEFCKLGCVCGSLSGLGNSIPDHCGREACMFECSCTNGSQQNKHSVKLPAGTDLLSASTMVRLQDEAVKHLAKEEKKFTQTVIKANNQTIVVGGGARERQRRVPKLPKKYNDYVNTTDEFVNMQPPSEEEPEIKEKTFTRKSVPIWKNCLSPEKALERAKSEAENAKCVVSLEKLNLATVLPWCMVHSLYKCYCGGKPEKIEENILRKSIDKLTEDSITSRRISIQNNTNADSNSDLEYKYYARTLIQPYPKRPKLKIHLSNDDIKREEKYADTASVKYLTRKRLSAEPVDSLASRTNTRMTRKKERVNYVQDSSSDDDSENSLLVPKRSLRIRTNKEVAKISTVPKLLPVTDADKNANIITKHESPPVISDTISSKPDKSKPLVSNLENKNISLSPKPSLLITKNKTNDSPNKKPDLIKNNTEALKSKAETSLLKSNVNKTPSNKITEQVKVCSLIDYSKSYLGLLIPTAEWMQKFQHMLNLTHVNISHIRLLQWPVLARRYLSNTLYLWISSKNNYTNVVLTETKRRPSRFHLNIKMFVKASIEHFKVPSIVHALLTNSLPGKNADANPNEVYVILVNYGMDWETRGTILLKNTQEMLVGQLSHKPVPYNILFEVLSDGAPVSKPVSVLKEENPSSADTKNEKQTPVDADEGNLNEGDSNLPVILRRRSLNKSMEITKLPLPETDQMKENETEKNDVVKNEASKKTEENTDLNSIETTSVLNKIVDTSQKKQPDCKDDNVISTEDLTEVNGIIFSSKSMIVEKIDTKVPMVKKKDIKTPSKNANEIKAVSKILASLPVGKEQFHWFMLKLENDFSVLKITSTNFFIKYTHLTSAIQMAQKNQKAVRIRTPNKNLKHHTSFGIYAVPDYNDRIFFGPYMTDKEHFLETFRYANGKLINTKAYSRMQGYSEQKNAGVWFTQKSEHKAPPKRDDNTQSSAKITTPDAKKDETSQNIIEAPAPSKNEKPQIEFVDLTAYDSDDEAESTQNAIDPLYNVLAADFSKHVAGDVTIQKLPQEKVSINTNEAEKNEITPANTTKSSIDTPTLNKNVTTSAKLSVDTPVANKIVKKRKIIVDLENETGSPAKKQVALEIIKPDNIILSPNVNAKIFEIKKTSTNGFNLIVQTDKEFKRKVPPLYPLNFSKEKPVESNEEPKKVSVSPKLTSILKPKTMSYVTSVIRDLGYFDVLCVDDHYQVPCVPVEEPADPKKFKDIEAALEWLGSYLKEKICHVPPDFDLKLSVWKNKEAPSIPKFNDECLDGYHMICHRGLFSVHKLKAPVMEKLKFTEAEITDILYHKFQLLIKKNIRTLGNILMDSNADKMDDSQILAMAPQKIQQLSNKETALTDKKKTLLESQKQMLTKINGLLNSVKSPVKDEVRKNIGNILSKNYSKLPPEKSISQEKLKSSISIPILINKNNKIVPIKIMSKNSSVVSDVATVLQQNNASNVKTNTEQVQNVKFRLLNGYFVPVSSAESGLSASNSSENVTKNISSDVVDLTGS